MGVIDFFRKKSQDSSKDSKSTTTLPTDEQIRATATIGFKSDWLFNANNKNIFFMAFEWIETGEYTKILRFNSLRSKKINYAPTIKVYCDTDFFFYDGNWTSIQISLKCFSLGVVEIPYPSKCMVKIIAPFTRFDINNPNAEPTQVEDYSNILEIDFSPEAIQRGENMHKEILLKEKEEREREEIEAIKAKIREKSRRKELEKRAIQEMMDENYSKNE